MRIKKIARLVIWGIPKRKIIYLSQEYERAVIFRLGRLLSGGARGPGVKSNEFLMIESIVFLIAMFLA